MAGAGEHEYPQELIESVEALSRLVVAHEDVSSTVRQIAQLAVHAVDGAELCSVTAARDGKIETLGATAPAGEKIDQLQSATNQGPCLTSTGDQQVFHIADMEQDETWPRFSERVVAETGVKSMLSYVLEVDEGVLGVLNLTSSKTDSFSRDDITTGTLFAAHAAVALANALTHEEDQRQIHQLEEAVKTRQLIGQAVGLVMASHRVDADAGFAMLVRISQNTNVKLRDVAQRLNEKAPKLN